MTNPSFGYQTKKNGDGEKEETISLMIISLIEKAAAYSFLQCPKK